MVSMGTGSWAGWLPQNSSGVKDAEGSPSRKCANSANREGKTAAKWGWTSKRIQIKIGQVCLLSERLGAMVTVHRRGIALAKLTHTYI